MPTAIEFNHISKLYRLGLVSSRTLSGDLHRWWTMNILGKEDPFLKVGETNDRSTKGDSEYVWALRDIDFKVEQGDVVGIIGKNGAGKSTLLKILSKITSPTTGCINARGRIASLLEVGTGFHSEMTGRENIYLNGAILGMTKEEIKSKLDEIIDFSGCERYIDTPVKRYSSGMTVRLGFAVAAFLDPEILVVDEVLAVGDAEFQKKAIGKMQDISHGEGRTVLFVSHNMASIRQLCHTGILLENGSVKYTGNIANTISEYQRDFSKKQHYHLDTINDNEAMQVIDTKIESSHGHCFHHSSEITVTINVKINTPAKRLVLGFNIVTPIENPIARCDFNDNNKITSLEPGYYTFTFKVPPYTFSDGEYHIVFDMAEADVKNYAPHDSTLTFEIIPDEEHFGNIYNELSPFKTSIIRQPWFVDYKKNNKL